jgi:DNA-binding NarL/FixJ family response regulator
MAMPESSTQPLAPDPIRVVVVDDVEAHRLLCALAIDCVRGMQVVGEARDGVEACELVEELQPDAIVLDLRMPRLDGFEAIPLVRTLAPHVRIVVWSGTAEPEDIERAVGLGAHAVVRKLAASSEVAGAVRSVVESYRAAATSALFRTASRGGLLNQPADVSSLRPWARHLPGQAMVTPTVTSTRELGLPRARPPRPAGDPSLR